MKGGYLLRPPCRGVRGHPGHPGKILKNSSPRKRDSRHSEAKSACFNISFFKVKMPFFLHQTITKTRVTKIQICVYKTMIKVYCISFIFFQFCVPSKTGWKKPLSFIEQRRLNLVMNSLHLSLTVFYFIFLQVFDVSCFNLGGSIEPPEPPYIRHRRLDLFAKQLKLEQCKRKVESSSHCPNKRPLQANVRGLVV